MSTDGESALVRQPSVRILIDDFGEIIPRQLLQLNTAIHRQDGVPHDKRRMAAAIIATAASATCDST